MGKRFGLDCFDLKSSGVTGSLCAMMGDEVLKCWQCRNERDGRRGGSVSVFFGLLFFENQRQKNQRYTGPNVPGQCVTTLGNVCLKGLQTNLDLVASFCRFDREDLPVRTLSSDLII
jgi:hypothetical protein